MSWQRSSGYNRRSLVETTMFRYKTVIGRRLHARILPDQRTEAKVRGNVLGSERRNARRTGLITEQTGHACGQEALLPPPDGCLARAGAAVSSIVPQPSAVSNTICARQTCFCGLFRSDTTASRRVRSAALTSTTIPGRIPQIRTPLPCRESPFGAFRQVLSTLMFAISSSRRGKSLLASQAVQRGRHWVRQEVRS